MFIIFLAPILVWCLFKGSVYYLGAASNTSVHHNFFFKILIFGGVASDDLEVITVETVNFLSGAAEGDEECNNPFACLEEDIK